MGGFSRMEHPSVRFKSRYRAELDALDEERQHLYFYLLN